MDSFRNAPEYKKLASPYRQALYYTARRMRYSKERALQAAKMCDPKVVKKFESGK